MLHPGSQIDRYIVLHELGSGGMARVYAVRHAVLGTRHALKVLHTTDASVRERLIREGRFQASIDTAHIVPVTDVLDVRGSPALLMPLVDGCALDQLLEAHRPSEDDAMALFVGITRGVAAAHEAGVVHRDLKPANVLLELRRGQVVPKVADFGIAKDQMLSGATQVGVFMGTPLYASPEQLVDASSIDHRADIWALGVMLVELLTGQRAFSASTFGQLMSVVAAGRWDSQHVPERWRRLTERMLEPDPARRVGSVQEVLREVGDRAALSLDSAVAGVVRGHIEARTRSTSPVPSQSATTYGEIGSAETLPPPSHNLPSARDVFV
ncbi:MAG: serine/threonine protein kinase, partial [Kiritimatiellia bacterium]